MLNDRGGSLDDNLSNSLLFRMIEFGRDHPLPANSPVPETIELGLARKNECPVPGEFEKYADKKPQQGMPLAIAGLSDREYETLRQWVFEGAIIDEKPWQPDAAEQPEIEQWEAFFNGSVATQAETLIRNKAHTNVAFMFNENDRRERDKDTLTVYPGLLGSYPNYMFHVPLEAGVYELSRYNKVSNLMPDEQG